MRPRDLFGVAVRVIGLWFLTQSAYWFFWAAVKSHNPGMGNPNISIPEDLAYAILYLALGGIMLLLADPIVWFVYGLPPRVTPSDEGDVPSSDIQPGD